jgi:HlyD family secretion protein
MTRTKKRALVGTTVVAVAALLIVANLRFRRDSAVAVYVEAVTRQNLEAIVSASGKLQPKRSVNISADTMGRVVNLAVEEGDRVEVGQFLLQIDPRNLRSAVERTEAGLLAARAQLEQARAAVESARAALSQAEEHLKRQRELWSSQLTTRDALERAETERRLREAELKERLQQVATQELRVRQERAALESARYDLSKVTIVAPISGIVTRRNIEEGETVVVGTMNNPGTVLLTIADMSVVEAEVEVDETDIPAVRIGQRAKVTIDALPDRTFAGKVTAIGNSPIQPATPGAQTSRQATNFKVVVTLEESVPQVRPGFTCTADITTATRQGALAVPIQAMVVREVKLDAQGRIVREAPRRGSNRPGVAAAAVLKPGETRKELEGVFVLRGQHVEFVPVKTGIAGDRYFEVLSGLREGDQVVVGPYNTVRDLADGARVKVEEPPTARATR